MLISDLPDAPPANATSAAAPRGPQPLPSPALDLVAGARETLHDELAPLLSGRARELAQLIERALDAAQREATARDAADSSARGAAVLADYRDLYGDDVVRAAGAGEPARLEALEHRLTRDIRDGTLDGACARGVRGLLYARTRGRLETTNPAYLSKCDAG